MELNNRTDGPERDSKAELIQRLDAAIAVAKDIRRQWEEIGAILEDHNKIPLAA
jgi:hypothetical protein